MNEADFLLKPVNTGVLLHFYDDNPYKTTEKSEGGLIISAESTKRYKSN